MGSKGIVASTAAMAVLLQEGIGDTIRVSLTPEPDGDRTQEVIVAQEMLQTMGLRSFTPMVIACPGCGRTTSTYFQELAQKIQSHLRQRMPEWRKRYPGVEEMTVAVMGCVVNGPGESKHANIGISLPGTGERPVAPVYIDGEKGPTLKGERIAEEFQQLVEDYVERTYGSAQRGDDRHDTSRRPQVRRLRAGTPPLADAEVKRLLARARPGLVAGRGWQGAAARLPLQGFLPHDGLRQRRRLDATSRIITDSRSATTTAGSLSTIGGLSTTTSSARPSSTPWRMAGAHRATRLATPPLVRWATASVRTQMRLRRRGHTARAIAAVASRELECATSAATSSALAAASTRAERGRVPLHAARRYALEPSGAMDTARPAQAASTHGRRGARTMTPRRPRTPAGDRHEAGHES